MTTEPFGLGARHEFLRRWGVPPGWSAAQIGDLAEVVGGGTPSTEESRYWFQGSVPWATPTDITKNDAKYISSTAERITTAGLAESSAQLLPAGSVLLTSRATIGAKAIGTVPMATNQGFASLIPRDGDGEYLYYLLDMLTPSLKRLASGTTFDEVSKRDVRRVWCAIPEDPEERADITRLLASADTAIELTRAGRRAARDVKCALAQRLLREGIRGEPLKTTGIGCIPESWEVVPLRTVVEDFQYGLSVAMQQAGHLPILRMGNIRKGDVVLDELKYVSLEERVTDPYLLNRGDVLFNRTNSQEHVGKVGVYRQDLPAVFASYLIRVHPDSSLVEPYFLGQLLGSYNVQCRIKRFATPGVQQVNVNATNLGRVLIPMPPGVSGLHEQGQIAAILEAADNQIKGFEPVLETLHLLRSALSRDLVTGAVRIASAFARARA